MVYVGLVAGGLAIYLRSWSIAGRSTNTLDSRHLDAVAQQWYATAILLVAFLAWWRMSRLRIHPSAVIGVLHAFHVLGFIACVFVRL